MAGKQAKILTRQQVVLALRRARRGRYPRRDRVMILLSVRAGLRAIDNREQWIPRRIGVGARFEGELRAAAILGADPELMRRVRHADRNHHHLAGVGVDLTGSIARLDLVQHEVNPGRGVSCRTGISTVRVQPAGHSLIRAGTEIVERDTIDVGQGAVAESDARNYSEQHSAPKHSAFGSPRHFPVIHRPSRFRSKKIRDDEDVDELVRMAPAGIARRRYGDAVSYSAGNRL